MKSFAGQIQMGVDYYPEQWDCSLWEQDIQLMKLTGVRVVRVAEFAWGKIEPSSGSFEFKWLTDALDLFHKYGMKVVLGTPTNTPPRWLTELCPDVLPVMANGEIVHPGVRGHRCYNSESLRAYGLRVIGKMTEACGKHPAVIGWQIDNEFGMIDCHCEACDNTFREWLKKKYGSLDGLNQAWGTSVWSGDYSDWSQAGVPLGGSPHQNPSYLLDYTRFQWDSIVEFQQLQIEMLRQLCPEHFITHNFHSYPQRLNLYRLGDALDVAAFDYYPNTSPNKRTTSPYSGALSLDVTRGIKRQNFWIMEQLSGPPGCWFPMWRTPHPGFIRASSWQAIARGADTVVHFRWRSAVAGAEQFWHGLIDHSNRPGRRFEEFSSLCHEVNELSKKLEGTTLQHEVAILQSYEQLAAFHIQPQVEGMDYYENIKDYHRALTKLGIGCDVIDWNVSLDDYKIVIAPGLFIMNESTASRLEQFAQSGGTLILTSRSGVKNMDNQCVMMPLPGLLSASAGIVVEEYDPIGDDVHQIVSKDDGVSYGCRQWCDVIQPITAEIVAYYGDDFFEGKAAVTRNFVGSGEVYYLGTHADENYLRHLFINMAEQHGITVYPDLPEGVQITVRSGRSGSYLFLLNLSRESHKVALPDSYRSVLYEVQRPQVVELEPYGVEIMELE